MLWVGMGWVESVAAREAVGGRGEDDDAGVEVVLGVVVGQREGGVVERGSRERKRELVLVLVVEGRHFAISRLFGGDPSGRP